MILSGIPALKKGERVCLRPVAGRTALDADLCRAGYERTSLLSVLKEALCHGLVAAAETACLMDALLVAVCDHLACNPELSGVGGVALLAVGGYGRRELAPFSDLDLLFLVPDSASPACTGFVEQVLYVLWDLGLKVGYAVRTLSVALETAGHDMTACTALLDSRWLWGDRFLAETLQQRFRTDIVAHTGLWFVAQKLAERDRRHIRRGDSRYILEPDIKEDKGGLRDLHTLQWIVRYLYGAKDLRALTGLGLVTEATVRRFLRVEDFLWVVRFLLHDRAGRADDRLTFDAQKDIATLLGYTVHRGMAGVERFMRHYFLIAREVGKLTRIFCAVLEGRSQYRQGVRLDDIRPSGNFLFADNRLSVIDRDAFLAGPLQILQIFRMALNEGVDLHPESLRLVAENARLVAGIRSCDKANALFLEMLLDRRNPESVLRLMNETGVLGHFIPAFGHVVAHMQYDMYHVYTVDEHAIRAIGILHRIESGALAGELPVACQVVHTIPSRRVLYVALFLHDLAKGRGGDHSVLGAELALELGPRLGLTAEKTDTVSWLVRCHLAMSRTAFRRDIDDPQTIAAFAGLVQSPGRLKLLLVLTCADIRAVGPSVWSHWKAVLLRTLYVRTLDTLSGGLSASLRDARIEERKATLRAALPDLDAAILPVFIDHAPPALWLTWDVDAHIRHARLVCQAARFGLVPAVESVSRPGQGTVEITVYAADRPGVFSLMAGALSLAGCSIVSARIVTLSDGMVLDCFVVEDQGGELGTNKRRQDRLRRMIVDVLSGVLDPVQALKKRAVSISRRQKVFAVPVRVMIDNDISGIHTVIEINGPDRPAFLHDVTRSLTALGLQIASAHVCTYGERVVDVFYVKDVFGLKVVHPVRLQEIRHGLTECLADLDACS